MDMVVFYIYFHLGGVSGFDEGYNLGTGELCSFNNLPTNIRDYVSHTSKVDLGREITQDWFMRIDIDSLGQHKSLETAIQQARTNVSIYKLTHLVVEDDYYRPESYTSPYRYVIESGGEIQAFGYDFSGIWFYRDKSHDRIIFQLTDIVKKDKERQSEIEKGITSALNSIGIIENSTPLHLKFLIPVFSLEGLILTGEDKDYSLRKKLPEKIVFLILDKSNWREIIRYLDLENSALMSLSQARVHLAKKLQDVYDKRSAAAHPRRSNEKVLLEDYNFVLKVLRQVVIKLAQLNETDDETHNRITHIKREKGKPLLDEINSLDVYIESLKYR
jgi:hypothetical protein